MLKAVILCGGRGRRLRPLTETLPKPLVPLMGVPILKRILDELIRKGIREFVLCTGFHSEAIRTFVASNVFDARIHFSDAGEEAGILKRIHTARPLLGDRTWIAYGDTFMDLDPWPMLKAHEESGGDATLAVADSKSPFGHVRLDPGTGAVVEYEEKPILTYYVGNMILETAVLDRMDRSLLDMADGAGLIRLFQNLIAEKKLFVFRHTGFRLTFNTLYQYEEAEKTFIHYFTETGA
ncbi:MAG: Glucose-1-phosphate cytidylyltransferase [Syntrophaceae bacterium PtaU1.Bin231]|nr:MAG: Glucose-1-phosphate cytidylyltransferase [Syntrophaceae bacterium PtaU1.Bin231]